MKILYARVERQTSLFDRTSGPGPFSSSRPYLYRPFGEDPLYGLPLEHAYEAYTRCARNLYDASRGCYSTRVVLQACPPVRIVAEKPSLNFRLYKQPPRCGHVFFLSAREPEEVIEKQLIRFYERAREAGTERMIEGRSRLPLGNGTT